MLELATRTERMIARKDGAIGWMIFNNPARHNAVSVEMWEAVPDIIADFAGDEAIRVIVLAGAGGRAFVSGADISEFGEKRASRDSVARYNELADAATRAIADCAKPTIAMIQGYCIGGGVAIALCCDLRIASDESRFGVPAARLGIGYAYSGIERLADLVGPSYAKEIFFTARQFDAAEALQMGLINRIRRAAELESYVRDYAETIGANAPLTVGAVKLCVAEYLKDPAERDLAACQTAVDGCSHSGDYAEGRTAFMEKRRPVFLGR
jgi:enoyl-CoA hydratase/carnithine racemase